MGIIALCLLLSGSPLLGRGGLLTPGGDETGWTRLGTTMSDGRWSPSAALLAGGKTALIAGGYSFATRRCVASADIFDEATRRFQVAKGRLNAERDFATASLLPSGQVLIAGGFNTHVGSLDTAEIYDPATEQFRPLPSRLSCGRELFQATSLADGRVLLTGGLDLWTGRTQNSADIFDPKTEKFSQLAATMADDRFGHAAARLADGRVLIVGGTQLVLGQPGKTLASAEIYDPKTGRFHSTHTQLSVPRGRPTATLLPDGRVLIAGGQNGDETPRSAELFDPRTERFTPLAALLLTGRMAHSDALLSDGCVLLAGGWDAAAKATTDTAELYDPKTQTFLPAPPLPDSAHDAALLVFPDGLVLFVGGKQVTGGKESSPTTGAVWQAVKTPQHLQ